jgi:hypothetical protein
MSLRGRDTYTCTVLTALSGGRSPHNSSTSRPVGTSSFARSRPGLRRAARVTATGRGTYTIRSIGTRARFVVTFRVT